MIRDKYYKINHYLYELKRVIALVDQKIQIKLLYLILLKFLIDKILAMFQIFNLCPGYNDTQQVFVCGRGRLIRLQSYVHLEYREIEYDRGSICMRAWSPNTPCNSPMYTQNIEQQNMVGVVFVCLRGRLIHIQSYVHLEYRAIECSAS